MKAGCGNGTAPCDGNGTGPFIGTGPFHLQAVVTTPNGQQRTLEATLSFPASQGLPQAIGLTCQHNGLNQTCDPVQPDPQANSQCHLCASLQFGFDTTLDLPAGTIIRWTFTSKKVTMLGAAPRQPFGGTFGRFSMGLTGVATLERRFTLQADQPVASLDLDVNNLIGTGPFRVQVLLQMPDGQTRTVVETFTVQGHDEDPVRVLSAGQVQAQQMAHGMTFLAQGASVDRLHVQVFSLSGDPVFAQTSAGNALSWNLLDQSGRRVANGVYFYRTTVRGTTGQIERSEVKKLVILR